MKTNGMLPAIGFTPSAALTFMPLAQPAAKVDVTPAEGSVIAKEARI